MTIHWVDCHIEDLKIEKGQFPIRRGKDAKKINQPLAVSENVDNKLLEKAENNKKSVDVKADINVNTTEPLVLQPGPQSDYRNDENEPIISPTNKASTNWLKHWNFALKKRYKRL